MEIQLKHKFSTWILVLFFLLGCNTQTQEERILGSWEFIDRGNKTLLLFEKETFVQHYSRFDTSYEIRGIYKLKKDTLILHFINNTREIHYLKWLDKSSFILSPQEPNKLSIPAIDLVEFRKVK
jgi:hypothetical protein